MENIALHSWWLIPYAYYIKNNEIAGGLKKEFETLCMFFQNDYYHKIENSMPEYTNRSVMDI